MAGDRLLVAVGLLFVYLMVISGYTVLVGAGDDVFMPDIPKGDVVSVDTATITNITELPVSVMLGSWELESGVIRCKSDVGGTIIFDYEKMTDPDVLLSLVNLSGDYSVYLATGGMFLNSEFVRLDWSEQKQHYELLRYTETFFLQRITDVEHLDTIKMDSAGSRLIEYSFHDVDADTLIRHFFHEDFILSLEIDGGGVKEYKVNLLPGGAPYPGLLVGCAGAGVSFVSFIEKLDEGGLKTVTSMLPLMLKVLVFNPPEVDMPPIFHWLFYTLPLILFVVLCGLILGEVSPF